MPGTSGLQLPLSVSPDCTIVHEMMPDEPLNRLSMRHVPEKSAAQAAPGASAVSAKNSATLIGISRA
jgi:hypothetical protein